VLTRLLAWLGDAPLTVSGSRPSPAAHSSLVHAAANGPVLVVVSGGPEDFGPVAAAALEAEMTGLAVRFTADPAQAKLPQVRVELAFAHSRPGRIAVQAAFRNDTETLASAFGRTTAVASPGDPRLSRLLGQLAHALFDEPASP
jgi:hypothetical protein